MRLWLENRVAVREPASSCREYLAATSVATQGTGRRYHGRLATAGLHLSPMLPVYPKWPGQPNNLG